MQAKNLHNLEEKNLLEIIKKQQEEIDLLKAKIESLENRIKQIESIESIVHDATDDKNLSKSKKGKKETKEESQTNEKENMQLMVLPKHTSLAILMPRFLKKLRDSKKIKLAIVYTISFLIVAFSLFQIGRINYQKNNTIKLTQSLQNYINIDTNDSEYEKSFTIDFEGLKSLNSDTVGWIIVPGVNLSFPVVKTNNNEYYLKHSFDKTYNPCGWIFADSNNKFDGEDKNIIIYGHNRRDGTMFSPMTNILNPSWYNDENNKYITLITEQGEEKYEVFSIYQREVEDYYIQTNFRSTKDYLNFLNTLKSRSTKDYQVTLTAKDQILTLSTCGKENKLRVVLHAKKVSNNI